MEHLVMAVEQSCRISVAQLVMHASLSQLVVHLHAPERHMKASMIGLNKPYNMDTLDLTTAQGVSHNHS